MLRCFFDVDGVVLDFESAYLRVISAYFQLDLPENFHVPQVHVDTIIKNIL